jgi:hypothetical protein
MEEIPILPQMAAEKLLPVMGKNPDVARRLASD